MFKVKSFTGKNPNPKLYRENYVILDGKWDFQLDKKNRGEKELWFEKFKKGETINVPYSYVSSESGIDDKRRCDHVWYHREISIDSMDYRYLLHLDGADYETTIYLNGLLVKTFRGAYHRLTCDISDYLRIGNNDLTIKCDDSYSANQPRGKQRMLRKNYLCWYEETTGIYKSVWMEKVPKTYIHSIDIDPDYDRKSVDITIVSNNPISDISVCVSHLDKVLYETKGQSSDSFIYKKTITLSNDFFVWDIGKPELYDLKVVLRDGEMEDVAYSYFGFRKIETKGSKVLLNGKEIYLKMCLDQGYTIEGGLTVKYEERYRDIDNMMKIGFNGARMHQKIEVDNYYAYADMVGFLTWLEMPSMYRLNDESMSNFKDEYKEILREHSSYPSIITIVPFNESWGVFGINRNKKKAKDFINEIVDYTRKADPTRLVISNDGWCHLDSDIYTIHLYNQDPLGLKKDLDMAINDNRVNTIGKMCLTYGERKDRPYMLSEFGGTAFSHNLDGSWGYGTSVKNKEEYEKRLKSLFDVVFDDNRLIGYCYTQLYDVRQEINGIYQEDHEIKLEEEKIRTIQREV